MYQRVPALTKLDIALSVPTPYDFRNAFQELNVNLTLPFDYIDNDLNQAFNQCQQVGGRSWIYVQHVNLRAARRFTR